MIKLERGSAHINGENVTTIEVWRTDSGSDTGSMELVAIIPLDREDEKIQVEL